MALIDVKAKDWRLYAGLSAGLLLGCDARPNDPKPAPSEHDAGKPPVTTADAGIGDAGGEKPHETLGGLVIDTKAKDQNLDLLGVAGHHIWAEISDEQRDLMNQGQGGFGGFGGPGGVIVKDDVAGDEALAFPVAKPGGGGGDIGIGGNGPGGFLDGGVGLDAGWSPTGEGWGQPYRPPSAGGEHTFADHFVIQDAVSGSIADYGRIEVKLVGSSTYQPFTASTIPNLRMDTDQFKKGLLIGGFEHFRLNNNSVGKIFREALAHRVYRALGYPALRATHAFLGSNVWGEGNWIPMTLIEVYKPKFCEDNKEALGGKCVNMWEFTEDPAYVSSNSDNCQFKQCDDSRLMAFGRAIDKAPQGAGFKNALEPFVDWERFHQFQCLSWIMWTADDPIHTGNNAVIVERDDGKLVWLPYSVDISTGLDEYQVGLYGSMSVANGCQQDPECWRDTIASCEDMITRFDALNPETFVDESMEALTKLGMMRKGDDVRAKSIRSWYAWRQKGLSQELDRYREPLQPGCYDGYCPDSDAGTGYPALDGGGGDRDAGLAPDDAAVFSMDSGLASEHP